MRFFRLSDQTGDLQSNRWFAFTCLQVVLQAALLWATNALIIWNIRSNDRIAAAATAIPILAAPIFNKIGIIGIKQCVRPSKVKLQYVYQIVAYSVATFALLFQLVVSLTVRRVDLAAPEILALGEIQLISERIVDFTTQNSGIYPEKLEPLFRNGLYTSNEITPSAQSLLAKWQSRGPSLDFEKFEYYGAGLHLDSHLLPVPILASREAFHSGDRLMMLQDGRVLRVQSEKFDLIHHELFEHKWNYHGHEQFISESNTGLSNQRGHLWLCLDPRLLA